MVDQGSRFYVENAFEESDSPGERYLDEGEGMLYYMPVPGVDPFEIAKLISTPSPYKLRYVGPALALEYLRNVGIRAGKPDVHVLRILGGERLGYIRGRPTEQEAVQLVADPATQVAR